MSQEETWRLRWEDQLTEVLEFWKGPRFQAQIAEGIGTCLETEDSVGLRVQMVVCAFILLTTLLQFSLD